jgi:hypothetical protein
VLAATAVAPVIAYSSAILIPGTTGPAALTPGAAAGATLTPGTTGAATLVTSNL